MVAAAAEPKSKRQKLSAAQCLDAVLSATAARDEAKAKSAAKKETKKAAKKETSKDI